MMPDDIKADEIYEKIKRRAMDKEFWITWFLDPTGRKPMMKLIRVLSVAILR